MGSVHRSALVPYQAEQMFDLVNDIERYPDFLHWCSHASVEDIDADTRLASLTVALAAITQTLTTRNQLQRPQSIQMSLVSGPFRHLSGLWTFDPLGQEGCKVSLDMDFALSNRLLDATLGRRFAQLGEQLVQDFCQRAAVCYG